LNQRRGKNVEAGGVLREVQDRAIGAVNDQRAVDARIHGDTAKFSDGGEGEDTYDGVGVVQNSP
jgi:hypothetical protein